MQKVLCPKVLVRKKMLPYGSFFLHPNFYGLSTFYMAFMRYTVTKFNINFLINKLKLNTKLSELLDMASC